MRFYPQRSSGQAVVTDVVPSPPRYVPSFLSRIGFSIPAARPFSSNVATVALALSANQFLCKKITYEYVHSARIESTKLILVGTRITYQATICTISALVELFNIRRQGVTNRAASFRDHAPPPGAPSIHLVRTPSLHKENTFSNWSLPHGSH